MNYPDAFLRLVECFKHLPGIGAKSAERLVYHCLDMPEELLEEFAQSLLHLKKEIRYCKQCGNISTHDVCDICADSTRDQSTLMIVEKPQDVFAMEKIKAYHGLYLVLHGVVSMMDGVGIDDLNVSMLLDRLEKGMVKEVIIATGLTRDGETTALYLARLLQDYDVQVTRIAHGLPIGSHIDYADELTLLKSLEGRTKI